MINNQPRGVRSGTKRAPYATKKIETVTINFRVPKSVSEACKDFVRPLLKEFLNSEAIILKSNLAQ
jgi:hypothetical protein